MLSRLVWSHTRRLLKGDKTLPKKCFFKSIPHRKFDYLHQTCECKYICKFKKLI